LLSGRVTASSAISSAPLVSMATSRAASTPLPQPSGTRIESASRSGSSPAGDEYVGHGQRDQSVLARAPAVPHLAGRPSKRREDVPGLQRDGSVVSQLRADAPCGWLGDVPGREEVRSPVRRPGCRRGEAGGFSRRWRVSAQYPERCPCHQPIAAPRCTPLSDRQGSAPIARATA
jgi:hypothetical protein